MNSKGPRIDPCGVLATPTPEIVAEVFPEEEQSEEQAVSRTKGDIIGFSDVSSQSDDEYIDIQPNVKFLPATVEGLRERFHELYTEFTRQGKHEPINELVFLLDELLRQQGIDREEYTIFNNTHAKSLGYGIANDEEEEEGMMVMIMMRNQLILKMIQLKKTRREMKRLSR